MLILDLANTANYPTSNGVVHAEQDTGFNLKPVPAAGHYTFQHSAFGPLKFYISCLVLACLARLATYEYLLRGSFYTLHVPLLPFADHLHGPF